MFNPYLNIRLGVSYLSELTDQFETEPAMLTAYRYGPGGAYSRCFNDAEITSEYATIILDIAARIEKQFEEKEAAANGANE